MYGYVHERVHSSLMGGTSSFVLDQARALFRALVAEKIPLGTCLGADHSRLLVILYVFYSDSTENNVTT